MCLSADGADVGYLQPLLELRSGLWIRSSQAGAEARFVSHRRAGLGIVL